MTQKKWTIPGIVGGRALGTDAFRSAVSSTLFRFSFQSQDEGPDFPHHMTFEFANPGSMRLTELAKFAPCTAKPWAGAPSHIPNLTQHLSLGGGTSTSILPISPQIFDNRN